MNRAEFDRQWESIALQIEDELYRGVTVYRHANSLPIALARVWMLDHVKKAVARRVWQAERESLARQQFIQPIGPLRADGTFISGL